MGGDRAERFGLSPYTTRRVGSVPKRWSRQTGTPQQRSPSAQQGCWQAAARSAYGGQGYRPIVGISAATCATFSTEMSKISRWAVKQSRLLRFHA